MLAHQVLRAAATIIEKGGWSQEALCRDASGRPVPLFRGDNAKAGVNPSAVSFSLYAAICKAVHEGGTVQRMPLIWDVLYRHASQATDVPHGGENYVHPVMQFNETAGRTKEDVLALLEIAAQDCEEIGDGPFPPPVGVSPARQILPLPRHGPSGWRCLRPP